MNQVFMPMTLIAKTLAYEFKGLTRIFRMQVNFLPDLTLRCKPETIKENNIYM